MGVFFIQGRSQKGSIYVWAAGNGGKNYDSCAADGFVTVSTPLLSDLRIRTGTKHTMMKTAQQKWPSLSAITQSLVTKFTPPL